MSNAMLNARKLWLDQQIQQIDSDIATVRAELANFKSEKAIDSDGGGVGYKGSQRLEQLLALRETYTSERATLAQTLEPNSPWSADVSLEAGTDLLGNDLDEH